VDTAWKALPVRLRALLDNFPASPVRKMMTFVQRARPDTIVLAATNRHRLVHATKVITASPDRLNQTNIRYLPDTTLHLDHPNRIHVHQGRTNFHLKVQHV
jgi:hypothetical protein